MGFWHSLYEMMFLVWVRSLGGLRSGLATSQLIMSQWKQGIVLPLHVVLGKGEKEAQLQWRVRGRAERGRFLFCRRYTVI